MKSDPLWHPPQLAIVRMPPGSGQDQVDLAREAWRLMRRKALRVLQGCAGFTPPASHIINVMPPLRRVNDSLVSQKALRHLTSLETLYIPL